MVNVLNLSNLKATLTVTLDNEMNSCEATLNDDLSIKTIGVVNDIPVTPDDLDLPLLNKINEAILDFSHEQSLKRLRSDETGSCYKLVKSQLFYAPILKESNEADESLWAEVSDLSEIEPSVIQRINNHFKSNF